MRRTIRKGTAPTVSVCSVSCCTVRARTLRAGVQHWKEERKDGRTEGRKEGVTARGCVVRCVVCTGCGSVQAIVSSQCVLCVFVHGGAAVCHCASESTRVPTLRGDTRSSRAMHRSFRSLSRFHTVRSRGFPLSPLGILGWAARRGSVSVCSPGPHTIPAKMITDTDRK